MRVDTSRIQSTRTPKRRSDIKKLMCDIPVGSLVRIRWAERIDAEEFDQGVHIEEREDFSSESVVVLEWHPKSSFVDTNGNTAVEFTCLWRGELFKSTSYCIDEVLIKGG